MASKPAYKRPYKSRKQRREDSRRKYDESKDYRFLWRAAGVVGILLVVAIGFAVKGLTSSGEPTSSVQAFR